MQKYKVTDELLEFDLENFLSKYSESNSDKLILKLKSSWNENFDLSFLIHQLKLYKKCKDKIPSFANTFCWLTPKSYEQASSELSALYKSSIFKGDKLFSVCGGLGVDDWAFSKTFSQVISLDLDEELNKLVRHNFRKLKIENFKRITTKAEDFIKEVNNSTYDLIYIDADRRSDSKKKSFLFENSSPNPLEIISALFEQTETILIKLSPLIDLNYCEKTIPQISKIFVISVENEVKEVLLVLSKTNTKQIECEIQAVNIDPKGISSVFTAFDKKKNCTYIDNGIYFIEPYLSIIKAGLVAQFSESINAKMISKNSNFLLSDSLVENSMGRFFKIVSILDFKKSELKKYLASNCISKANISKRNFPLKVDELRKVLKLKDGGEDYIFFTQNSENKKLVYHCRKIKSE